jgi:DNA invertase Pin-like site-specific DNA recombinase
MRCALYARVSTTEQNPGNQLLELRRYCEARGWQLTAEFVDHGVSGALESRPALDDMRKAARRRRVDAVVVWKLDRLGRNLKHLILAIDELAALGVAFVSLNEGIDTTTPAGRLQLHILGAIAEFERSRCAERVKLGLQRARAQGRRLGRPRAYALPAGAPVALTVRQAAAAWGCSKSAAARRLSRGLLPPAGQTLVDGTPLSPDSARDSMASQAA